MPLEKQKVDNVPLEKRGWLRNGNTPGNPHASPRCGARTRTRQGAPCRNGAMKNGRCRLHGGLSTGPKTDEGKKKSRLAPLKHGYYSSDAKIQRKKITQIFREIDSEKNKTNSDDTISTSNKGETITPPPNKTKADIIHETTSPNKEVVGEITLEAAVAKYLLLEKEHDEIDARFNQLINADSQGKHEEARIGLQQCLMEQLINASETDKWAALIRQLST